MLADDDFPVIFLGVADYIPPNQGPHPYNPIDIFQLSKFKRHLIFPVSFKGTYWLFLLSEKLLDASPMPSMKVRIRNNKGEELLKIEMKLASRFGPAEQISSDPSTGPQPSPVSSPSSLASTPASSQSQQDTRVIALQPNEMIAPKGVGWILVTVPFHDDAVMIEPGKLTIEVELNEKSGTIGEMHYLYHKVPPFTPETIKAIESNLTSVRAVIAQIGCKHCTSLLKTYAALQKDSDLERDGHIWYSDLPETPFICQCGKSKQPLQYLKENLHALLGRDKPASKQGHLDYVRRYAHTEVIKVVQRFNELLDKHKDEGTFQKFIEENPLMLAMFHSKALFVKPNILGKFQPDFAVFDTSNRLIFIELERPSMNLFKKDGHPTADLWHAYGQVEDWLHEYEKHPAAVLEALKLTQEKVMAVNGAVIAGRSRGQNPAHIKRHMSNPAYARIQFLTLDDLSSALQQISKQLA